VNSFSFNFYVDVYALIDNNIDIRLIIV